MKKPNFFIVGAPKCGTTSLAAWLAEHPQVYLAPGKEPHFFNRDGAFWTRNLEDYEKLFVFTTEQHLAIGEASTRYLYSQKAVPLILEYNPDAKFIVCVRSPIDMAQSLHSEMVWLGQEPVREFSKAWQLQSARKNGKNIPLTMRRDPERLQYGQHCRLGEQINRLYTIAHRERVMVLVLDDIASNPVREYRKVLSFLGVNDDFSVNFDVHNSRKHVKWAGLAIVLQYMNQIRWHFGFKARLNVLNKVQRFVNKANSQQIRISPEMRVELVSYFSDDIHLLEILLERDFSHWITQS